MRLQKLIVLLIALSMSAFLLAGCQSDDSSSSSSGFSVSPGSSYIAMGASTQLTATNNGTDVTSSSSWSSSDTSVVSVSNTTNNSSYPKGTITAKRTGTATITATYSGQSATSSITVTSATLSTVEVNPINPSLALAATPDLQFTATGIYSDGTKLDLTKYVTWSSGTTATATISNTSSNSGKATTVAAGTSTISAVYKASSGDVTGSSVLTLTSDTVDSLEVTPINPSIANSTTQPYTATILVTDGTTKSTQDVTKDVVWTSTYASGTNPNSSISNASDSPGLLTALATGSSTINASFGATSATASTQTITAATLNKLQIFPAAPSIAIGVDYQLTAKGIYLTGSVYTNQDLTDSVVWSSSDTSVATICNSSDCKGIVSPLKAGTSTITASMPGSITKTITLTVKSADMSLTEIQIMPTNPSIYSGTTQQFTATGIYSDGTSYFHEDITDKVTWSSSDKTVAIISNASGSAGKVSNIAAGTATITATLGKISSNSTLTILASTMALNSIEVSPANPYIAEGMKQQFTAMGIFTDGTTTILKDITNEVIWTYTWVSGANPNVRICNADNCKGQINSMAVVSGTPGVSTITATLGSKSGSSTITVFDTTVATDYNFAALEITPEPSSISIAVGASIQFKAIGIFKITASNETKKMNLTDQVTWISSDPTVASVDNLNGTSGLMRGLKAGSTSISASWTDATGTTPTAPTKAVSVNSYSLQSLQISPSNQTLPLGMTAQFKAQGIYSDGTNYAINSLPIELTWLSADSSSSSTINAPIGSEYEHHGLATTLTAGTNTITAKYDSKSASETLTSSDISLQSITINPSSPTIGLGTKLQCKAYGSYSDGVNRDITDLVRWTSGTTSTAVITNDSDNKALVTSVAVGTSAISASLGSNSASTTLTVKTNNASDSLQVTPSSPVIGAGTTMQLSATGIFADTTSVSQDLTDQVYWTTDNTAAVTVSNDGDTNGRIYGVAAGTATLTAYWKSTNVISGSVTVTVTSGSLSSIEISPDQPDGPVGYTEQLTATALYSDNNPQDITESVIWTSSDTSVVTVSNEEGSRGQITRKTYGTATITARFGTTTDTATVSVW